jgi:D-glycero-alpha-D-manno-heptose-7-phosphate kinase
MIITRTPFRISFFGGGTDYPVYYREHGGAVLSTTINKYCYLTCRYLPPFFDYKYRIRYTKTELTQTADEIQHPSVKACLNFMGINEGIELIHSSDIPALSGVGSSSSFTVGLLHALSALKGQIATRRKLAFDAIHVEQDMIGESVGCQDQMAAAFGGFNKIEFGGESGIFALPITLGERKLLQLQDKLLFYFTGFSRTASEIASEQIRQTPGKLKELKAMHEMVDEAINILNGKPEQFDAFGKLLHKSWQLKRKLTPLVSTSEIDNIYDTAMRAGAIGGKLCGAGGGGFMLFYVPTEAQPRVKEALKNLLLVPFRFETLGSHIVFYST